MTQPRGRGICLLVAMLLLVCVSGTAQAESLGKKRIQRTDGTWITGEVEETPSEYIVKVTRSATVTIPKNQVKAVLPVEEGESPAAAEKSEHPEGASGIPDAEIEKLLEGFNIVLPASDLELEEGELPLNEESVEEMKAIIETTGIVTTKHVVVVYTGPEQNAKDIARRLETIWRWNIRFMRIINLPVRLPEYKLELYYVDSREEFDALCTNVEGGPMSALGFFTPVTNRSHFYNMMSERAVKARLEHARRVGGAVRTREENLAKLWAEYQTLEVTQHELGHHIHYAIGLFPRFAFMDYISLPAKPTWLVEGTTMQFEIPPSAEGGSFGAFNHERLNQFRRYYPKPSPDFLKLFMVDSQVWYSGGGYFYPMGWALVYYMREKKPAGLAQYYRIIAAREAGEEISYSQREREIEECFGKINQEWVDEWWDFMSKLELKRSLLPPENYP